MSELRNYLEDKVAEAWSRRSMIDKDDFEEDYLQAGTAAAELEDMLEYLINLEKHECE